MALPHISLAVVGVKFPNKGKAPARLFEIALCRPGDPVQLVPEPKNSADPQAIAVYSQRDVQIGYVTAERAPRVGQLIRLGHEITAVFQEAAKHGAVIRVAFDGEVPVLPEPRPDLPAEDDERRDPEPDFYPDEVWPDE